MMKDPVISCRITEFILIFLVWNSWSKS